VFLSLGKEEVRRLLDKEISKDKLAYFLPLVKKHLEINRESKDREI
jgi:hypothetical protein